MTEQDKQLLLQDLYARLPYNVIIHINHLSSEEYDSYLYGQHLIKFQAHEIRIKPYLRPMSSMTEEEIRELNNIPSTKNYEIIKGDLPWDIVNYNQIDWLNAHHFDYRGLIKMGLALEAPEGMYNTITR